MSRKDKEHAADAAPDLFSPIRLGPLNLPNRIVMAPLTRNRAGEGNVPNELNARYYTQRASAGLIISEATQISLQGVGYPFTPGIHSEQQVAGWRMLTDAVHQAGGRMFLQLWHVGRISHPSLQPDGGLPVAPSAVRPAGEAATYEGMKPFETPRALEPEELPGIVGQYGRAAENAKRAGFDGVEIHNANGYLLDQFLRDGTNKRKDRYGGPLENRVRLSLEVVEAVLGVWSAERVGIRISPSGVFNDMSDSDPRGTFGYFTERLNAYALAYLHVVEPEEVDLQAGVAVVPARDLRPIWQGKLIACGGYGRESAARAVARGEADMIAFGRKFIANPDLPQRLRLNAPLNEPDPSTFYGGTEVGYVDYPRLDAVA